MSKPIPASLVPCYQDVYDAQLKALKAGRSLELCADVANSWAKAGRENLADAVIDAMHDFVEGPPQVA